MKFVKWFRENQRGGIWIIACVCFIIMVTGFRFFWGDSYFPAKIINAYLCELQTPSPVKIDYLTLKSEKEVYVCGQMKTDGRPATIVALVWGPKKTSKPISADSIRMVPGDVIIPVNIPVLEIGKYHIQITDQKEVIADLYLDVKE